MASILGQFYTRIKGSQEDIASEGLTYILQKSFEAKQVLNNIFLHDCGIELGNLNYTSQNVGEELERPDIVGINSDGKEIIILETKFWASFTENQPVEYLNRLSQNSILCFVVPELRIRSVNQEISNKLKHEKIPHTIANDRLFNLESGKAVIIKTWNELLNAIRIALVQNHEQNLVSDIDQIIGFCEAVDSDSFMPFQNEEISPKNAKRINSYYDIADKLIDEMKKRGLISTKGLNATPQKYGYTRYFRMENYGLSFNVSFDLWEKVANTPFWLGLKEIDQSNKWFLSNEFKQSIKRIGAIHSFEPCEFKKDYYVPIYPEIDKTEDVVIEAMIKELCFLTEGLTSIKTQNTNTK